MPECLLLAYHDNLDRLRAERMLDAAQVALVPHLSDRSRKSFLQSVRRRTVRLAGPDGSGALPLVQAAPGGAPFTVDGIPTDSDGLKRWLGATFGVLGPGRPTRTVRAQRRQNGHQPAQGRGRG